MSFKGPKGYETIRITIRGKSFTVSQCFWFIRLHCCASIGKWKQFYRERNQPSKTETFIGSSVSGHLSDRLDFEFIFHFRFQLMLPISSPDLRCLIHWQSIYIKEKFLVFSFSLNTIHHFLWRVTHSISDGHLYKDLRFWLDVILSRFNNFVANINFFRCYCHFSKRILKSNYVFNLCSIK